MASSSCLHQRVSHAPSRQQQASRSQRQLCHRIQAFSAAIPRASRQQDAALSSTNTQKEASEMTVDRRQWLGMLLCTPALMHAPSAQAFTPPPPGFRSYVDKLDGYSFVYPDRWLTVTVTGNDCFLRNPVNIDENLFVDISSPSSSKYVTVTDLGTPEQTAKSILEQYLNKEFMSTRLGIKREGSVLSATSREGADGRTYYDIAIRMTSYGSKSPYVATQGEVMSSYGVEWDRVLFTTLGVANKRLYQFRLQTAQSTLESSYPTLERVLRSFTLKEVEV